MELDTSDATDLWHDALVMLEERGDSAQLVAALNMCTPISLEDGVLRVRTPMRMASKSVAKNASVLEECLSAAAFMPVHLEVDVVERGGHPLGGGPAPTPKAPSSTMSPEEVASWNRATSETTPVAGTAAPAVAPKQRERNPLVEEGSSEDSKFTFDRFVRGEENDFAYTAALQVANGRKDYNPLFIYGKSGLGKTHLLRAVQNYITREDPSRVCVYRTASSFTDDYTHAMAAPSRSAATEALKQNYADVDVLIIDDIQGLLGKTGTIGFFFDTFNGLASAGKQIVIAADRTPAELGMGRDGLDERVGSRLASGFTIGIQAPSYELKLRLIETFCERMAKDAEAEGLGGAGAQIPEDVMRFMAERAGTNIRTIAGFCQRCLFAAEQAQKAGGTITREDVGRIAKESWPETRKVVRVSDIQKVVEKFYGVSHEDLVGDKRNKKIKVARHVAIWCARDICELTYAEIGSHFGGRSHATVINSIKYVETETKSDKLFYDDVMRIKESLLNG